MGNNWKMKCLDTKGNKRNYTAGKIYEVIDGTFIADDGEIACSGNVFNSFDSFERYSSSKWELITDEPVTDNINPNHYKSQCSLECIEAMQMAFGKEMVYDFCICNAWKYMWRYENKNGIEDINKAQWYIDKANELIDYRSEHENIQQVLDEIKRRVK